MTYRDDQDALHQRVQELERDLERTRRDAEQGHEAQRRAAELQRSLAKAHRELARLQERLQPKPVNHRGTRVALIAGMVAAFVVAGATYFFVVARAPRDPVVVDRPPSIPPTPARPPVVVDQGADASLGENATLSRAAIQQAMRAIRGRIQGCFDRFRVPGIATVRMTIASSGSITDLKVRGIFNDTPTGACIAAAVKTASFPRFEGSPLSFDYPFVLR
jgi:hypothetical protein